MASIVEAAKRKAEGALTAAKGAVEEAPAAMQKATENPQKAKQDFLHSPVMRVALPFINGGAAGMAATTCIQPIDMIKVSQPKNSLSSTSKHGAGCRVHLNLPVGRGLAQNLMLTDERRFDCN